MKSPQTVSLLRSVRFRIAAWNMLFMVVAAVIAVAGLRQAIHWTLLHEVDQVLQEDGKEVALVVGELGGQGIEAIAGELRRKAAGHEQHQWFVQLLDADGQIVWSSGDPGALGDDELGEPDGVLHNSGDFRLLLESTSKNPVGITRVRLGSSLRLMHGDMSRIDRLLLTVVLLVLVSAPFCGFWLAGLATGRLERMTTSAAGLRPTQLNERLPTHGIGDEFDLLSETINHLLDRIADFIQEKRDFLAHAAHELRTPIAAIRASVEVSLSSDRDKKDYRELLEQILDETEEMEVLVNQVLLLSEADSMVDHSPTEEVVFSEIVRKSVEMFMGVAEEREVELHAEIVDNVLLRGVKRYLGQLVNNLIDNAIKYSQKGDRVDVVLEDSPTQTCLIVRDTGIGIAKENLTRIFDRFYREDLARQRDAIRGTGLGLSICKSIVDAHGGEISCVSEAGNGSEFTVTFPKQI